MGYGIVARERSEADFRSKSFADCVEKRDNGVVAIVPSCCVDQERIAQGVAKATDALASDVVRIRYDLGEDWSGDGAIFFRVLLKDSASNRPHLREVARRVVTKVFSEVHPQEFGLQAYFNFRSESEQASLKEEAWI